MGIEKARYGSLTDQLTGFCCLSYLLLDITELPDQ